MAIPIVNRIKSLLDSLKSTKAGIRRAIIEKGVTVYADDLYSTYPTRISQISMTPGDKDAVMKGLIENSLTTFDIPVGTSSLPTSSLQGLSTVTQLTIPNTVKSMGNGACSGMTSLTSITVPGAVEELRQYLFAGCTSLQTATLGEGITYMGEYMFNGCTSLTEINFPSTLKYISGLNGCTSLASVTIPNGVEKIYGAFNNTGLTSVSFPSTLTEIGSDYGAFRHCTELTSVTIPDSVTRLKRDSFYGCTGLTSVTIGTGITYIDRNVFSECTSLQSITINAVTPPSCDSTAFYHTNNCPIYVPEDSVETYKSAWTDLASRIYAIPVESFAMKFTPKSGGTPIEVELEDLATAGTIVIADVPSAIRNGASGTLEIGEGVTTIGMLAFSNCTGLTSVTIPSGVTTIQSNAFNSCSSLKTVSIPNTVTTISTSLFGNCRSLTSITIPDSVTTIQNNVFVNCTSLTSIEIPSSVTSIGNGAFKGCTSLDYVTVNATTPPTLGTDTFLNTNACPILVVPESVQAYKTAWSAYADRITCEGVAYWKLLGGTCDTNESGYNTGYITNTYEDANPTSPTYGNTRTETVQDEVTCPTQVWELIGSECDTDGSGKNTGYLVNVYEDVNPSSSTYRQLNTETVQDEETCPIPVAAPEFRRITNINDVTSGKYLIVDIANNIALNASLIAETSSSSNGINANNNYISVDIDTADDTIEATETTLNAAVDYNGNFLTWTDENSGTVYYLSPNNSGTAFNPNGLSPSDTVAPYATNINDGLTFKASNVTKAIAFFRNSSGSTYKFRWQATDTSGNFINVRLFKLDE